MKRISICLFWVISLSTFGMAQQPIGLTDPGNPGPVSGVPMNVDDTPLHASGITSHGTYLNAPDSAVMTPFHVAPSQCVPGLASEDDLCPDHWTRFHAFLFRRYAGSVEMESKTRFPKDYFGRYTYLPWRPDWVRTPANQIRQSPYRHHVARPTDRIFTPQPTGPNWRVARQAAIDSMNDSSTLDEINREPAIQPVSRRSVPKWRGSIVDRPESRSPGLRTKEPEQNR